MPESAKHRVGLREAIWTGVVLDLILLVFSSLILDGGYAFCSTVCLVSGRWAGNILILARRRRKMTRTDVEFVRFATLALVLAVVPIGIVIGLFQGR